MEQLLEKAFASIHRGQFSVAKTYLHEILKASDESQNENKNTAYLSLLDINKQEKKTNEYQVSLNNYLMFLVSNKKFEETLAFIQELENSPSKFTQFFLITIKEKKIRALDGLGHFQKCLEEMEYYLNLLMEIKQYDLAESYAESVIKKFPHQSLWQLYLVKIYLGKYQGKQAIEKFQAISLSLDQEKSIRWCADFVSVLSMQQEDLKIVIDYFETLNCNNLKNKAEYTKLINTLINSPSFELLFALTKSFIDAGRFNLAKSFLGYLEKNHKKQIKKHARAFKKIKDMLTAKRRENFETKALSAETILENKLERLKIDLSFCKKYESEDNYLKLLKKITKLDPFFVDEEELAAETPTKAPKLDKKAITVDPDEILRNLLSEISYYSSQNTGKEEVLGNLEKELSKTIEIYQKEILDSNYYDYILMLYSFKLYESALLLVNKVKDRLSTGLEHLKAYLEISYMEIVLQNEMGKTYDSLEILNFILSQLPLSREEKICFLYMAGESYYKLGQGREAVKYYKKILKLTEGYRLTKDRVKLLEKV